MCISQYPKGLLSPNSLSGGAGAVLPRGIGIPSDRLPLRWTVLLPNESQLGTHITPLIGCGLWLTKHLTQVGCHHGLVLTVRDDWWLIEDILCVLNVVL